MWDDERPDGGGDEEQAALAQQIKEIQRQSATAKQMWVVYCSKHGEGKYDPDLHEADFLSAWLDHYNSGVPMPIVAPEREAPYGEVAKAMQRKSTAFKKAWARYCEQHGHRTLDPSRHEAGFIIGFFDHLAQVAMGESAIDSVVQTAAKRMRITPPPPAVLPASMAAPPAAAAPSAPSKEKFVEAVKAFQRSSKECKEMWCVYADTFLGGTYNPSLHDMSVLQEFCATYGVEVGQGAAALAVVPWRQPPPPPGAPPPPAGAPPPPAFAPPPPAILPAGAAPVQRFDGVVTGTKEHWAQKLKQFQRSSEQNNELWNLYCDTYLGGVRDPSRHDATLLQEFCVNHDVEAAVAPRPAARRRAVTVPPPAWIGQRAASAGSASRSYGAAASAPEAGAWAPSSSGSPVKDRVVQAIHAFQRSSEANKDAWNWHADLLLGGVREPESHDASVLQDFCFANGIDATGGAPPAPPPPAQLPHGGRAEPAPGRGTEAIKADLVRQVKAYQREGPEQKEAWAAFSGGSLDPALHPVDTLAEFVQLYCE